MGEGNLEKVIGGIEGHKLSSDKTSFALDIASRGHIDLLEEKFLKILNNIAIIGKTIREAGPVNWYSRIDFSGAAGGTLYINKSPLGNFSMCIDEMKSDDYHFDYGIQFSFNSSDSLRGISMYTFSMPNPLNFFRKKNSSGVTRRDFDMISERNVGAFYTRYMDLIKKQIEGKIKDFPFSNLPITLNQVPKAIEGIYKSKEEVVKKELEKIESSTKVLSSLDASDF